MKKRSLKQIEKKEKSVPIFFLSSFICFMTTLSSSKSVVSVSFSTIVVNDFIALSSIFSSCDVKPSRS